MVIEVGTKLLIKSGNALHTVTVSHIIDENSKEPWYYKNIPNFKECMPNAFDADGVVGVLVHPVVMKTTN